MTIETTSQTKIHTDMDMEDDLEVDSFEDENDYSMSLEERKE